MSSIDKLLSIASEPLSRQAVTVNVPDICNYGWLGDELLTLLRQKNGFYAFEPALHVFPNDSFEDEMTLSWWNSHGLWRNGYGGLAVGCLFFAEDVFGNRFCLPQGQVCFLDAETGQAEVVAGSLDD